MQRWKNHQILMGFQFLNNDITSDSTVTSQKPGPQLLMTLC